MSLRSLCLTLLVVALAVSSTVAQEPAKKLKVGMIGLDTSHVIAFTKSLQNPKWDELKTMEIVAAFPGGSPDVESSYTRVEGFTKQLKEMGVEIVDSIDALLPKVDVVLLESVDGRPHLAQAKPVIKAGKPLFIDKPIAGSLADAIEIFQLAKEAKVSVFSSSSLRYYPEVTMMKNSPTIGDVLGCDAFGPCSLEKHHPDLFWYGIHGCEVLYTIMGTGCESVTRVHAEGVDFVTGTWKGGRVGTFRGIREGKAGYGAMVYGSKGNGPTDAKNAPSDVPKSYDALLVQIAGFFKTGVAPVSAEETIELFAFMEAADESKRQGGKPVTIESVIAKAKADVAARSSAAK
jgi:hypothetical protein